MHQLWNHQQEAVLRARFYDYFGLFFEVGTGKTRTTIEILEERFSSHGKVLKTLILTPVVVVENFNNEIKKFGRISKDHSHAITGSSKEKQYALRQIRDKSCILITNYEALGNKDTFKLIYDWKPEVLVCDEIHKIKDPTARRTKLCTLLSRDATYRYGLSGTPILNSQMDLFSQIFFLDHGKTFGRNFYVFRQEYFYDANVARKGTQGYFPKWLPKDGIDTILKEKISPFTMSVKKAECLDLPPLVQKTITVPMGELQARAYKSMKKDFIAYLKDRSCVADLAVTKALRLQQIVTGFIKTVDEAGKEKEELFPEVPRLTALKELLEDITPTAKVIVWCSFKKNYEMLETVCNALKVPFTTLYGHTVDKANQINRFQDDDSVRVMIANQASGGIGVNLTQASYMIYFSRNFSLEQEIQSEGRNYRGGSEMHDKVTRIDLISVGTIDEIVAKALNDKKQIGETILSSDEIINRIRSEI